MKRIAVAHFRQSLFMPTETFIYNYLTAFRKTHPVCFTFRRVNEGRFPYHHPIIELYKWNKFDRYIRTIRYFLAPDDPKLKFGLSKTYSVIEEYDVKVLHAHFGYTGIEVLPVKRKTNLPLVTTFYGQDISEMAKIDKWTKAYSELFNEGDLFLVEGPYMRRRLIDIGCPAEKAMIQPIAINLNNYPFRLRKPKEKKDRIRVLFCGTFKEKKGLLFALDAIRRAYEKFKNIEFRIIGDGVLRPQVEKKIDQFEMQGYTKLLGFLPHKIMINEMDSADIFIHPSITADNGDSEGGAPTTILEAQACGLPVLSTTHADIPNIVVPRKSALLSSERDIDSLKENLLFLLKEPVRWAPMGRSGRNFVEDNHDVKKEVMKLENIYFQFTQYNNKNK